METFSSYLPIYDVVCIHRGDTRQLVFLKATEPSRLKTAIILFPNHPLCHCIMSRMAAFYGRLVRPNVNAEMRFSKYFSAMLYTGSAIPSELPRRFVLDNIFEPWYDLVKKWRQFTNVCAMSFYQCNPVIQRPAKRQCITEKQETMPNSITDATDSDAMDIEESGDLLTSHSAPDLSGNSGYSADKEDNTGSQNVSVDEDESELQYDDQSASGAASSSGKAGAEQGAKPKEVVGNGRTLNGSQNSSESSDDAKDTKGSPSMPRSFARVLKVRKEHRKLFDQEVLQMFITYVDFMTAYAVQQKMDNVVLFEMTTSEPPDMKKTFEPGKLKRGKRTYEEKNLLFED